MFKTYEDMVNAKARVFDFNNKLKARAEKLKIESLEIFDQMQKNPAKLELLIDYELASGGAIRLLEMQNNNLKVLKKQMDEFNNSMEDEIYE